MKRKLLIVALFMASTMSAFFLGKSQANWADNYCKSNLVITDWNTCDDELSMVLSDGREIYAYKGGYYK